MSATGARSQNFDGTLNERRYAVFINERHNRETPDDYRADPPTDAIGRLAIMAHSALSGRSARVRGEFHHASPRATRRMPCSEFHLTRERS
jgi:hypothetical protein